MRRLQKHQTHTAKVGFFGVFFLKKNKHENVKPLLEKIRWLPFKDRIFFFFFKIAIFALRFFDSTLPPYLSTCLPVYTQPRTLSFKSEKKQKKKT